jgi:putative AlgH/UPF0301 family transcriptional regulator
MARPLAKRTVGLAGLRRLGSGPLDQELAQSSWLIMPVELDLIFEIPGRRELGKRPSADSARILHLLHMGQGVH